MKERRDKIWFVIWVIIFFVFLTAVISGCNFTTGSDGLSAQDDQNNGSNDPPQIGPPPGLSQNPPSIPAIVSAVASVDKIELSWSDDSPYEDGFIIKRDGEEVGHTNRNISVWTDTNISPEKTYCYAVIAYNKEWITSPSSERCVTVPVPVTLPPPPTNHSPVISNLVATQTSVEIGKQIQVSCLASDTDNDLLTYSWSVKAGIISGSGSIVQWTAPETIGTYTVKCDVDDGHNDMISKTKEITVTAISLKAKSTTEVGKCGQIVTDWILFDDKPYVIWWTSDEPCIGPQKSYLSVFSENSADAVEVSRIELSALVISPLSIAIGDGTIYVGGGNGLTGSLVALDLNKLLLKWEIILNQLGQDSRSAMIRDVAVTKDSIFVTGDTMSDESSMDMMVIRFDLDGKYIWSEHWGTSCLDWGEEVVPTSNGIDVYAKAGQLCIIFAPDHPPPSVSGDVILHYDY